MASLGAPTSVIPSIGTERTYGTSWNLSRGNPNLGFNVHTIDRDEKEALWRQVALLSPKLRYLSFLFAFISIILGEKVVIWLHYLWAQLLVELYLKCAGCNSVDSYHNALKPTKRTAVVRQFTRLPDPQALIFTYLCGFTGLNLEHKCRYNIIVEPAIIQATAELDNL